ncbi:MAG: VOC family protein [Paracoccaceae bacterium]
MISSIDHIVLTVENIERAASFYTTVLGMDRLDFARNRTALHFGTQKINLQTPGQETRNHARVGAGDLCLITGWTAGRVIRHLSDRNVDILEGPVRKSGAKGPITSVYFNDPDGNLVEVSSYERLSP